MAEIPSSFWIIAGIAIAITSQYVKQEMSFFFYVGIAFVIIGILKSLKKSFTKPANKLHGAFCPRCSRRIGHGNFCPYCGARVR